MSDWRLTPQNTALVVVDVQEKLMAAMTRRADVVAGTDKLLRAARALEVPVLVTLQYVKGLGLLCPELAEAAAGTPTFEKMTFSCCGVEAFAGALKNLRRQRVILCGVETHVCVQQTAIDLMNAGHFVYVCADAVCSRRDLDRDVALERMRDCGAVITTVESVIFEMLREAGTAQFKACLPLFK
jgi:nicotinamidase-related amidase